MTPETRAALRKARGETLADLKERERSRAEIVMMSTCFMLLYDGYVSRDGVARLKGAIKDYDAWQEERKETPPMKEILYQVGLKKRTTGEKLDLEVWAENCDAATSKCIGLLGANGQYRWTGTGPMRDSKGNVLKRELAD